LQIERADRRNFAKWKYFGFKNNYWNVFLSFLVDLHHQPGDSSCFAALTGALAHWTGLAALAHRPSSADGQHAQAEHDEHQSRCREETRHDGHVARRASGMTDKGGAKGALATAPNATAGSAGSASKTESRAKKFESSPNGTPKRKNPSRYSRLGFGSKDFGTLLLHDENQVSTSLRA
jgi:hypothetical protein